MSVTDNAGDAVLLHVSASSERQEWNNEVGAMKNKTEQHTLAHSDSCGLSVLWFYSIEHLVVQVKLCINHTHVNSTILESHLSC